jgi:hypothetical protein
VRALLPLISALLRCGAAFFRYRLAYGHKLCSAVLGVFLRSVFGALQRRAREELGVAGGRSGSVTFVQRFGGSINLHTHFHAIALDGVYADPENTGPLRFFALSPVSDEEVARVTATLAKRVVGLLIRRGMLEEDGPTASDPLAEEEPLLAACAQASVGHRMATGLRAGKHAGNSPMAGLPTRFATDGEMEGRMSCSSQRSCLKNWLSSCPGPAAMRSVITEFSHPRVSSADEALATVSVAGQSGERR